MTRSLTTGPIFPQGGYPGEANRYLEAKTPRAKPGIDVLLQFDQVLVEDACESFGIQRLIAEPEGPFVQYPEEQSGHRGGCLLNLVEQHQR